jgi:hypothetical protein
MLAPVMGT